MATVSEESAYHFYVCLSYRMEEGTEMTIAQNKKKKKETQSLKRWDGVHVQLLASFSTRYLQLLVAHRPVLCLFYAMVISTLRSAMCLT